MTKEAEQNQDGDKDGERPLATVEELLTEQAPNVVKRLHNAERKELVKAVQTVATFSYEGPMIPPIIAEGWERLVPGSAEKFMDEFLATSQHQRKQENRFVLHSAIGSYIAQIGAFLLGAGGLAVGAYTAAIGQPIPSTFIGTGGLAFLVAAYLKGGREDKKPDPPPKKNSPRGSNNNRRKP